MRALKTSLDEDFEQIVVNGAPDPRPFYDVLREQAPVFLTSRGFYYISRYDLAVSAFRDSAWSVNVASSAAGGFVAGRHSESADLWHRTILNLDGAEHARLRRIVAKTFSPQAIAALAPKVERVVEAELDRLSGRSAVDLVADFSRLLPTKIILDMMGISHSHIDLVCGLANAIVRTHEPTVTDEAIRDADEIVGRFVTMLEDEIELRRRSPRPDLLTALVEATDSGDSLSESELTAMVVALVVAGHETTASTLAVSVYHLLNNPVEATRLRTQPVIYKTAIEELLRYDAATRGSVPRYAVADIELGDQLVRKGEMVIVGNQASNHDPSVFEKPHSINLTRHPNKHISFFGGAHYCLGGWLARLELEAGLKGLFARYRVLELSGEVRWRRSFQLRALETLEVEVEEF